jgi:hypothetical protein
MSITEFLQEEVIGKRKSILVSSLFRQFDYGTVIKGSRAFANMSPDQVTVYVVESSKSHNGEIVLSVATLENAQDKSNIFCFKPKDSIESNSSIWKRESEAVHSEIVNAKPNLYIPSYALVTCESSQREISVPVIAPKAQIASLSNPKTSISQPSVSVVKEDKSSKQKPAPTSRPKFQIPLDRLDEPDEKENSRTPSCPGTPANAPPEVAVSIEDSSVGSPDRKRQKTVEEESAPVSVASSSPQYRQVVIKKKQVVTEYVMGENGEMIVRDVEKMIEEVKTELVPSSAPRSVASIKSSSSGASKVPKPVAPGQGKLTSFFKAKN